MNQSPQDELTPLLSLLHGTKPLLCSAAAAPFPVTCRRAHKAQGWRLQLPKSFLPLPPTPCESSKWRGCNFQQFSTGKCKTGAVWDAGCLIRACCWPFCTSWLVPNMFKTLTGNILFCWITYQTPQEWNFQGLRNCACRYLRGLVDSFSSTAEESPGCGFFLLCLLSDSTRVTHVAWRLNTLISLSTRSQTRQKVGIQKESPQLADLNLMFLGAS